MKRAILILLISVLSLTLSFSQENNDELVNSSVAYSEDFSAAIEMYKKLLLFDEESPVFHFKLGFCFLNTAGKEDSSLIFFQNAANFFNQNPIDEITINDINFYLAKSFRVNNKFDSAIIVLENLKKEIRDDSFKNLIKTEIALAEKEMNHYGDGVSLDIKNLGSVINSSYSEHSPVFSEDKTTIIFTSRKKTEKSIELLSDGQYDENIFISKKVDGFWTSPEPISDKINTTKNEASISLSPDGKTLFIYKEEDQGSIYYTEFKDNDWTFPKKLDSNINTRNRETHASITRDGKYLFFTSERIGGYGGLDIYLAEKQIDGTWGKPLNVGPAINTELDEDGPYITPDGKTLFFSSEGHAGYGGFDLFKSMKTDFDTWSMAENLGYPINSIEDDAFYCPVDSDSALYTSRKEDGFGQMDIYLLTLTTKQEDSLTVMTAFLTGCDSKIPYTSVNIKDNTTGKKYIATPSETGKFIFVTYKGNNYNLTLTYENKDIYYDNFDIPIDSKFKEDYKTIDISELIYCE
jgi:hypothetical protein